MTHKRYLEGRKFEGSVTVTEIHSGEKPFIRVEETWFHAQGGGQKADRGSIGLSQVIHVAHNGPDVDHYVNSVEGLEVGKAYPFIIDEAWAKLNSVYHTAGHLIASVVENVYPQAVAISGHQWPGEARVEFDLQGDGAGLPTVDQVAVLVQTAIQSASKVQVIGDPYRSREIVIADYKGIPCGGTHVSELNEIGEIRIKEMKVKKNKLRVSYESYPRG